jgi:8-oxo-dGTP diphosphatase
MTSLIEPNSSNNANSGDLRFAILATDIVVFRFHTSKLQVLLIDVYKPSVFTGKKAFPGGLIQPAENAEQSVQRLLEDKGGLYSSKTYIDQLYTFSTIDRDPRGRVVSVAYIGCVYELEPKNTSVNSYWADVDSVSGLAYDHDEILKVAIKRLKTKLRYTTVARFLLPEEFTLTELEHLYEKVLAVAMDKRNFRKKILKLGLVVPTGKKTTGLKQRPAELYSFTGKGIQEEDIL